MAGGPFTGASMNPVRTLGPAIWNGNWENQWIFWAAPLSAGLVASVFYKKIFWRQHPDELEATDPGERDMSLRDY
jgi:aquaporin related protein